MKDIYKTICAEWDTIWQTVALSSGLSLVFAVLVYGGLWYSGAIDGFAPLGSAFALVVGTALVAIFLAVQLAVSFPMGVRMGRTRRQMLAGLYVVGVVECLLLVAAALVMFGLDVLAQGLIYRSAFAEAGEAAGELLRWWYVLPLGVLVLPLVSMLVGSLPLLFGRRGMYVLWGVMAFAWVIPTAIMPFFDLNSDSRLAILVRPVALWLATVGPVPKIGLAAVLALALVVLAAWGVLRVDVKED